MSLAAPRIAITGIGAISGLGASADATFAALCEGKRGIAPLSLFQVSGLESSLVAEVRELDVPAGFSRSDALALSAAKEALTAANLRADSVRLGLSLGGTAGGLFETENELLLGKGSRSDVERALRFVSHPLASSVDRLAEALGPLAYTASVCSACSSGAVAIALGAHWIASGRADAVLAGGAEGLCRMTCAGFSALGVVDENPCRPFDARRAGLNLGEGAGILVLESEARAKQRGARVLAFLGGFAIGAEAHHVTHPEPSGERAAELMLEAISRAGLSPADVDYVNAHGTGTRANDAMEALALRRVFGGGLSNVRVSSSKAQLGHTLGASGALEAVVSVLALERGQVPPTSGLEVPEASDLRHVLQTERAELRAVASNSFGFGGMSAVLVFEAHDAPGRSARQLETGLVLSAAATAGRELSCNEECAALSQLEPLSAPFAPDPLAALDPDRSRRFDRASALSTQASVACLSAANVAPAGCGLVVGNAYGSVERSFKFIERLLERGLKLAPPAEFPQLVPSAVAANPALYSGLRGPVLAVGDAARSGEAAFEIGAALVELGTSASLLVGAVEAHDPLTARLSEGAVARRLPRGEGAAFLLLEHEKNAHARGRRPLARLGAHAQERGTTLSVAWAPPRNPSLARLVLPLADTALEAVIEQSPWAHVERCKMAQHLGFFEAVGAPSLAFAAALVARTAGEVLFVSGDAKSRYVVRLEPLEAR
jgi:3-oxoacyl-[acyl-carrier-protein] synthase II